MTAHGEVRLRRVILTKYIPFLLDEKYLLLFLSVTDFLFPASERESFQAPGPFCALLIRPLISNFTG